MATKIHQRKKLSSSIRKSTNERGGTITKRAKSSHSGSGKRSFAAISQRGLSTIKFQPIPFLTGLNRQDYKSSFTYGCIDQLNKAYRRYCKISNQTPIALNKSLPENKSINMMYKDLERIIRTTCPDAKLNIEKNDDGEFFFVAYRVFNTQDILFCLPLDFLQLLEKRKASLFKPMVWLYGLIINKAGFSTWKDDCNLSWGVDCLLEQANELLDEYEDGYGELISVHYNYTRHGEFYLKLINDWFLKTNSIDIDRLKKGSISPNLKFLKQWMIAGFELFKKEGCRNLSTMEYNGSVDYEDYPEYEDAVSLSRQFIVVWDADDTVTQQHIEGLDMDSGEYGTMTPCHWHRIDSKVKDVFTSNEWFNEFLNWIDTGFTAIYSYTEKAKRKHVK